MRRFNGGWTLVFLVVAVAVVLLLVVRSLKSSGEAAIAVTRPAGTSPAEATDEATESRPSEALRQARQATERHAADVREGLHGTD